MRARLLPLLALFVSTSAMPLSDGPATIRFTPILLDPADPARTRVGALTWLGGWSLASRDPGFGGLSGMTANAPGRLIAVGDAGGVFTFSIAGRGSPSGSVAGRLPAGPGASDSKEDRDAESVVADRAGRLWVGFERANAVWRYAPDFKRGDVHTAPPAMRDWPLNNGPEAIARLADGRFLVLCEACRGEPEGTTAGVIFASDPAMAGAKAMPFRYRPPAGYAVTDAAALPDGRLLILHRRFRLMEGVSAILSIADPDAIRADSVFESRQIAVLASPLTVDNMEALAVTEESGKPILWIASDDNFNPLQRSLLMKFRLDE